MLFNSQIFIFVFLPIVIVLYYGLHRLKLHQLAFASLVLGSMVFYGYENVKYVPLLAGSILGNYIIYKIFQGKYMEDEKHHLQRRCLLIGGLFVNLGILVYFKYLYFFVTNLNHLLNTGFQVSKLLLPLGISFFTFQQISFLVDTYKRRAGKYGFWEYAVFVSFFPQLVAGPIVLHNQLIPQFREEKNWRIKGDYFHQGIIYFILGLSKKTLIADSFGRVVDKGYDNLEGIGGLSVVFVILAYTLQIYFDFSGYSDMAIGLGKLFGVDIPVNFNMPYKSKTIAEFWKRWHITMTNFFTQYLYIPLGGNRRGLIWTCINTMVVFGLSGLWHGAGWSFVAWGLLHGGALVFYRLFRGWIDRLPNWMNYAATFGFVNIAWVFFRAPGFRSAQQIFVQLVKGAPLLGFSDLCTEFFGNKLQYCFGNFTEYEALLRSGTCVLAVLCVALVLWLVWKMPCSHELATEPKNTFASGVWYGLLATAAILTFSQISQFLYFNF